MPVSVNPATGEPLADHADLSDAALDAALDRASQAAARQREVPLEARIAAVLALADRLDADCERLARLAVAEMGKPLVQARAEVRKCAVAARALAAMAPEAFADSPRPAAAPGAFVSYEPLGTVLAIMPWNFPYWQAVRAAVPVVLAGGTVLLKHAPNVRGCGDALAETFAGAGEGTFEHLPIADARVAAVIADDRVAAVTLTGSERAGRAVAAQAGAALKPVVLELGGSDPFIVLADADVDAAVQAGVTARMQNSGQSCIAAKRFIVEAAVADAFTEAVVARVAALRVGDPLDEATDVGPLARADLREALLDQTRRAVAQGARLATGGTALDGPGFFVTPGVLVDVAEGTVPYTEELFGPIASISVARDEADAVRLANATRFGLGASVWTGDATRAERVARAVRAGVVAVNAMVASQAELPFGGVGVSGMGRELGVEGLRQLVNVKAVWRA
ncbi:MAG TPA: aldehyde dehydrogenase family protein [Rubricoccaceae bacterium]|jgi:succinate-semialdehyde dehydrogenase/glutarate-semialdehyde dehydrogenase